MGLWLYASGDGESNAAADEHLIQRLRRSRARLAMIPASSDDAEHYYDEFVHRFSHYGCRRFQLLRLDRPFKLGELQRALQADLIYLSGGNTFHLLSTLRRSGVGKALLDRIEAWAQGRGFKELCSDALLSNVVSHAAHAAWGFEETERVVYFRKPLNASSNTAPRSTPDACD